MIRPIDKSSMEEDASTFHRAIFQTHAGHAVRHRQLAEERQAPILADHGWRRRTVRTCLALSGRVGDFTGAIGGDGQFPTGPVRG
jgi:hypothetical protein